MSVVGLLGARPVAAAFTLATRGRLRVLAYHGVPDVARFEAHLDLFGSLRTVTSADLIAAVDGVRPLPPRPLWITFDDGVHDVVTVAQPMLAERGMVATAFVCPALLDTCDAPWWNVVADAATNGLTAPDDVARLKRVPDAERRTEVSRLSTLLDGHGAPSTRPQLSSAELDRWVAAGNEIGNHTWDHPCLDRCEPAEQAAQIERAHKALTARLGTPPRAFAWPNGNVAESALPVLRRLGYRIVAVCDHRVERRSLQPEAVSRLRLDTDADVARARAILSGGHSAVFRGVQFVRRLRSAHRDG